MNQLKLSNEWITLMVNVLPYLSLIGSSIIFLLSRRQRDANVALVEASVKEADINVDAVTVNIMIKLYDTLRKDYDRVVSENSALRSEISKLRSLLKSNGGVMYRMYGNTEDNGD